MIQRVNARPSKSVAAGRVRGVCEVDVPQRGAQARRRSWHIVLAMIRSQPIPPLRPAHPLAPPFPLLAGVRATEPLGSRGAPYLVITDTTSTRSIASTFRRLHTI